MATFLDIASLSLTKIGQIGTGQTASNEMLQQALTVGNLMLDEWSIDRLLLYNVNTRTYVLTANKQDYTVGPSAVDFVAPRPTFIETARVALPGSKQFNPLNVLDRTKWGAIRDVGATCSPNGLPQDIWPEYTFENLTFHLWTIPANAATILLGCWEELQQFQTLFDLLNFPPGYGNAIMNNLAQALCAFYDMPTPPEVAQSAALGLARIRAINAASLGGSLGESQTLVSPSVGPTNTGAAAQPVIPGINQ